MPARAAVTIEVRRKTSAAGLAAGRWKPPSSPEVRSCRMNHIPEHRLQRFEQLRRVAVKTSRAWAIKETLRRLWDCRSREEAEAFFRKRFSCGNGPRFPW